MAKVQISAKRIAIDKANATMVIVVGVAAFVSVFCIAASKTLLDQRSYQERVNTKKEVAVKQLRANIEAVDKLMVSYEEFTGSQQNILGGNSTGNGERDGDNARVVLDALPSKYDFPALTTSVEKLVKNEQFKLDSITGTDDEVAQSQNQASIKPTALEIPFDIGSTVPQPALKDYMQLFERSIRPFQIRKLTLSSSSDEGQITIKMSAKTYYQPAKSLNIRTETVK